MPAINLPKADRSLECYSLSAPREFPLPAAPFNRRALAAAHVVADPLGSNDPWLQWAIDWDATVSYREYLWSLGLGVAEAMDTAQRGMGLDWTGARALIRQSLAAADGREDAYIACGVGTDHLEPGSGVTIEQVIGAYEEQIDYVESLGGRCIVMASRALAACAAGPNDYERVYDRILSQVAEPVILHWLGEMFDPALDGYWGYGDRNAAMDVCLSVIESHAHKVDGIKISLLDRTHEISMRRRLPNGVRMYTGDDFDFASLIAGDEYGYSDALLGIFDAIAPAASAALSALSRGGTNEFFDILEPTIPMSRHIFSAPTRFYKTGIVLLAFLNGHQDHFVLVGGQESARSVVHLAEVFRLADKAGLLRDGDLAVSRMKAVLSSRGVH